MLNNLFTFWSTSVARQLILGIALVHALLMSIFVFDLVGRQRAFMIEQNTSQAIGLAEALAVNGTSWLLANDIVGIEEVIRSQSRFPGLDYALFLDMSGKVLGYTERSKVGLYIIDPISQKLFNSPSKTILLINNASFVDVATPVMSKNQQIGWARVGVSRHDIVRSLDVVTSNGLIYTLIAISVGILFAWFMARGLTSALRELMTALQKVIEGRRDIRCEINRKDEMGTLSQDFNLMLSSINEQEKEIKQVYDTLFEREVKFRRLLEALSCEYFLYSHDKNGVFTFATPSVTTILGYSLDEFKIDCNHFLTRHPKNEQARIHTEKSIKGELQPSYEIEIYHKNGDKVWLNISEVPIFDEQNNVISVEGIAQDISQRKNFEMILHAKELEQREILDNILDGVFTMNIDGLILTCNPAIEKIFGYPFSELTGKSFAMLFSASSLSSLIPDNRSNSEQDIFDLIGIRRQDKNEVFVDINAEHKEGFTFPVRLSLAKLSSGHDGQQRYICSCFDLTEQKYQEEKLRRSQKMDALGKLTGGIAHDFNNLLGIILGYSELLLMKIKDNSKLEKYIDEIHHAGERGEKLTKKLLSFSRDKEIDAQSIDINALLSDNHHMLAKSITTKIELKYKLADNVWPIWFDQGDMEDILINLVINAMQAMPKGGVITIQTENKVVSPEQIDLQHLIPGDYVHLSVTDTGLGMDERTRSQIFDPFFTTKENMSSGLGLSQVYGYIQRAGADINVYSELGHGSCFSMLFPRLHEKNSTPLKQVQPTEIQPMSFSDKAELILFVDDESSFLTMGSEILSMNGYQVLEANSASMALKLLEENAKENKRQTKKISLMISDVLMPEMDGYQLARIVADVYPEIKIQLSSGYTADNPKDDLDASLYKDILVKPYTSDELLTKVRAILNEIV